MGSRRADTARNYFIRLWRQPFRRGPFVGAPRRVIYRGKPTYRQRHRAVRSIRRGENFQSSRGSRSISAGSFTTPEFVTNSGASAPDVYYPCRGVPTDK